MQVPYQEIALEELIKHVVKGNRLSTPEGTPADIGAMMHSCWGAVRPDFVDLEQTLRACRPQRSSMASLDSMTSLDSMASSSGVDLQQDLEGQKHVLELVQDEEEEGMEEGIQDTPPNHSSSDCNGSQPTRVARNSYQDALAGGTDACQVVKRNDSCNIAIGIMEKDNMEEIPVPTPRPHGFGRPSISLCSEV